ncbi:MAG TPA: hypothetical protein VJO35_03010 [Terriglobales bacterium]|nr:hypothetical protein [Terriglobales bacterium]
MKKVIRVTEAPRIVPASEKFCTGKELASALASAKMPTDEAREWARDLRDARKGLKLPSTK